MVVQTIALAPFESYCPNMGTRGPVQRMTHVMACLALALFTYATVKSVVMQAAAVAPHVAMTMCLDMPMGHMDAKPIAQSEKGGKTCVFCDASSHAPLCSFAAVVPATSAIAWQTYTALRPLGPRGPPSFVANARGPPQAALTI